MNGIAALGGIVVAIIGIVLLTRRTPNQLIECVRCHGRYFAEYSTSRMPEFFCSAECERINHA